MYPFFGINNLVKMNSAEMCMTIEVFTPEIIFSTTAVLTEISSTVLICL